MVVKSTTEIFDSPAAAFTGAEAKTFYRGTGIFMGGDASMFILEAQK
jgi:hypothetical protein